MNCREVVGFLDAYLSGTLQRHQRLAFEAHLHACPPCVVYLQSYTETVRLTEAVLGHADARVPEEVPEELVQAILAARRQRG